MPRRRRCFLPGVPVHVVQRGNNRQVCFTSDADLAAYANWLCEAAVRYGVAIHAWAFMTNHVHMLMTPEHDDSVSNTMQHLGRRYVRYFNWKYDRTGTLFEGRFKASLVQTGNYFLNCQRYIELNPVRAGMVDDPGDYVWSSYRAHAMGASPRFWVAHSEYISLGNDAAERQNNYRALFNESLCQPVIKDIRKCINSGLVLGTERFRSEVERLTGERQRLLKRGRPPRRERVEERSKFYSDPNFSGT